MSKLDPPWVPLAIKELHVKEFPGKASNPEIEKYFEACGASAKWALELEDTDSVPWCGAFIGWLMKECGYPLAPEPLRARSWLDWGEPVDKPYPGVICVFRRGTNPKTGHVGIVHQISDDGKTIYVLGANQQDSVCIQGFPVTSLLGYRIPPGYKLPTMWDAIKESPIAKDARDIIGVTAVGGATKAVEVTTDVPKPPQDIVDAITSWQGFSEQLLGFAHFVGKNLVPLVIIACMLIAFRILSRHWNDTRTGRTGGM